MAPRDEQRRAADKGDADAMLEVGKMCYAGVGVKQDRAKAASWFRKAADAGDEDVKKAVERLEER